ncbi:MAG TPA: FAD-dependent oxidoreductase [Acidimicrobiales bacterium]|nr:FAD-dependent oxidoreductase [Acidimicrobiales bacterium]
MPGVGTEPRRYDAVVVGAALGGVASAAMLARQGWKVALVEALPRAGGRVGGVERDGWWIDWGHRDGHGIGDLAFIPVFTKLAAAAAGAELSLRPLGGRYLRVHWLPEGRVTDLPADAVVPQRPESLEELCRSFGDPGDDVATVAAGVAEVLAQLSGLDEDQADRLVPVPMGQWLVDHVPDRRVHRVILQQFECVPFTPAATTSVGRYAQFLATVRGVPVVPDDAEVGGVAGVVEPFVRAFRQHGGDVLFGWQAEEVLVHERQVRGVVALDEASLVAVLEAPVVITDYPGWRLPEFVDERYLPKEWLDAARATERFSADAVSWWAGLRRLPTRRADGAVESFDAPWQRFLYGEGAIRECHGGFLYPSAYSRRSAPEGKHLLCVEMVGSGEGGPRWRRWPEAQASIDMNVDYLRQYYADLDECVEWSSYQYVTAPQYLSWYAKPVRRHPVEVAGLGGLYVASSSAESRGAWIDAECAAALEAVSRATAKGLPAPPADRAPAPPG